MEYLGQYLATPANPTSKCMANSVLSSAPKRHAVLTCYSSSLSFFVGHNAYEYVHGLKKMLNNIAEH